MNVQGFLLSSFGLALALVISLDAIDETINVTVGRGRLYILFLALGPRQDQMTIEVNDFIVQPLAGSEASNVLVRNLLSAGFGYCATFGKNCIDICLVSRWEARR